ncbi:guanylate kinase [Chenggangzhangella methanolivorans]|uniref:Guanylate kinase n=1 Tax=Chenggangzhangella methanolivorans TaxID=1437009 RepID=A0A9E6UM53_9HYPH|nr:guanylate kinase [Chenggangzhangella methanolivorans]QZN99700.1 guanylate kinase [Chenggangzhangella methanolivorans]
MADPATTPAFARRGVMLILSSPSGAGKSTLTRNLIESDPLVELSISVTTREKRGSEINGRHYHFITRKRFDEMRDAGDLLEWAEVHGNCYGTPREPIETALATGRDVLFDIDWQGTEQVREKMAADVATVFVLPPSAEELRARLERRAEDTPEVIARRLRNAAVEIAHWEEYDYVVVNDDLDRCFKEIRAILDAERLKRLRRPAIGVFAKGLVETLGQTLL